MQTLVIGSVLAAATASDAATEALECCEALKVSADFFYSQQGARTFGLRGLTYEWDINSAGQVFYFNETWGRWVYGYPGDTLYDGPFITHMAAKRAECPVDTDWVRLMDVSGYRTHDIFERPVRCTDPQRRIVLYDRAAKQFYGDSDEDYEKFDPGAKYDETIKFPSAPYDELLYGAEHGYDEDFDPYEEFADEYDKVRGVEPPHDEL